MSGREDPLVAVDVRDGVMTLTLRRSGKRNALNAEMYKSLAHGITQASADAQIGALVITGSEGNFSSGNDLHDFVDSGERGVHSSARAFTDALVATPVPVLAAVDGWAVGIGATMLLHADYVCATPSSRFQMPFVALGVVPEAGSTLLLPRVMGNMRASMLLLMCESITAEEALAAGFVSEIAPDADSLLTIVHHRASKVASLPSDAVATTKRLLRHPIAEVHERIALERSEMSRLLQLPATKEGIRARLNELK